MIMIAGIWLIIDLKIGQCILTKCRKGCPVERGSRISEVRIREVRVYVQTVFLSNSPSDNGFPLFANASVIKKLTFLAASELYLAALKKDC